MGRTSGDTRLFHCDPRALCPVQEPLEVEGGQAILRLLANVRGEGGNRPRVPRLQEGKGVEVTFGSGTLKLFLLKRLKGADHLASSPQFKIADRPTAEILDPFGKRRADTNAGAELFVDRLKPRCDVDGIAISGVIEKPAAPEIADDGRPGMNTDAGYPESDALFVPALGKPFREFIQ